MSSEAPTTPYLSGRYGMTIPIDRVPLSDQREWIVELEDLGYTDVWSSEANTTDAFSPLALASAWAPSLRLGTAIVPAYTRGPALLAQSVASLADAAPGRFDLSALGPNYRAILRNPLAKYCFSLVFLEATFGQLIDRGGPHGWEVKSSSV